jgi:hypothetical protein
MAARKPRNDQQLDAGGFQIRELKPIARSLAMIAMRLSTTRRLTEIGEKATFLKGLGFDNEEIAGMVGSTAESIRVNFAKKKKPRKTAARKRASVKRTMVRRRGSR